ncbi:MAG: tetratricopeptide repeat protein [bacterium]
MNDNNNRRKPLGKVDVKKKALRIQELGDKMKTAVAMFQSAQKKFEQGKDSYNEWQNIAKILDLQVKDTTHFLAVAHHNMGIIHAGRKEYKKAREKLEKAIELDPDYAVAHYNMALVYKKLDNMEKCKEHALRAKELGYDKNKPAG